MTATSPTASPPAAGTGREYKTVAITPASACRGKNRFARKRQRELAELDADGWEIVAIEPERFLRPKDKVTVQRPRQR